MHLYLSLPHDMPTASIKAISPHSAIYYFLIQCPASPLYLKLIR